MSAQLTADKRRERDERALQMFLAGATYQQIMDGLQIASIGHAHRIVSAGLAKSRQRRQVLLDQAIDVQLERTEALFRAHYPLALRGEVKSGDLCRRLLVHEARLQGLLGEVTEVPDSPPTASDGATAADRPATDLAKFRANRGVSA
jgi:hypothetical protein